MLKIENIYASVENKPIIHGLNLVAEKGETHIIMGPNGSGKSTLCKILTGHPLYKVKSGTIEFDSNNLLSMEPDTRAHRGLFLAFQQPLEIAGVSNYDFLRIAYNTKQRFLKKDELAPIDFLKLLNDLAQKLNFRPEFLSRNLNEGFSGGEKKLNEVLQMLLLAPKLVVLDEIDSGLDIDALKLICKSIKRYLPKKTTKIVITHYSRILRHLRPTFIHIMIEGRIIKSGGLELASHLEKKGYANFN